MDFLDVVGDVAFSVIAVVADGALERFELGVHKKVVEKLDAAVKQLVTVQALGSLGLGQPHHGRR